MKNTDMVTMINRQQHDDCCNGEYNPNCRGCAEMARYIDEFAENMGDPGDTGTLRKEENMKDEIELDEITGEVYNFSKVFQCGHCGEESERLNARFPICGHCGQSICPCCSGEDCPN